jgi:hypothetical protein
MKGDEPLLMKPSVVFTPFGTEIFIPGYISFDPKRDLKPGGCRGCTGRVEFGAKVRAFRLRGLKVRKMQSERSNTIRQR